MRGLDQRCVCHCGWTLKAAPLFRSSDWSHWAGGGGGQRFTCKPVSPPPWCPCCQRVLLGIHLLPAPHPQGYQRPPASVYAAFALPSKAKVVATEGFERDFYFLSSDLPGICILVKDRHFTLEVFKTGNRPFRSGGTSFFFFLIFSRINSGLFNSFLPPPFLSCH